MWNVISFVSILLNFPTSVHTLDLSLPFSFCRRDSIFLSLHSRSDSLFIFSPLALSLFHIFSYLSLSLSLLHCSLFCFFRQWEFGNSLHIEPLRINLIKFPAQMLYTLQITLCSLSLVYVCVAKKIEFNPSARRCKTSENEVLIHCHMEWTCLCFFPFFLSYKKRKEQLSLFVEY